MFVHWKRTGGSQAGRSMLVNGLGAAATGTATVVVLVSKFANGAWITVVLIPGIFLAMRAVRSHYDRVERETALDGSVATERLQPPLVVAPMDDWSRISQKRRCGSRCRSRGT